MMPKECKNCKYYELVNKDDEVYCCNAEPQELTDTLCLLRNIMWTNLMIYNTIDERDEGDNWKM